MGIINLPQSRQCMQRKGRGDGGGEERREVGGFLDAGQGWALYMWGAVEQV